MNEKDIHNMEQAAQDVKEQFAPALKSFYDGCIDSGFSPSEALELTKTFLVSIVPSTRNG